MDSYELKQDAKEMLEILRQQRKRVSSKEEAEKVLTRLGIMHLLVPIKKKSKSSKTSKRKNTGRSKPARKRNVR